MPKPLLATKQTHASNAMPSEKAISKRQNTKGVVRAWLYDRILMGLTSGWYREVLSRLPAGASLLDVGIGTGSAIVSNAKLVRAKDIHILGLDIDRDYLRRCEHVLSQSGLSEHVTPCLASVYDHCGG